MAKRRLKNWSLIFAAIFGLLVSPVAAAACECPAHEGVKSDERAAHQSAENDCHSAAHTPQTEQKAENDCETALNSNGCCCANNAPQTSALSEKKSAPADAFNQQIAQARFEILVPIRFESIQFYYSEIFHRARSALSEKPSRAPPRL